MKYSFRQFEDNDLGSVTVSSFLSYNDRIVSSSIHKNEGIYLL